MERAKRKPGRPALWESDRQRERAYRSRRSEKVRLVDELLLAARNAWWGDRQLQAILNDGDDAAVLRALTAYYRQRHWSYGPPKETSDAKESS